jgi:hypothetical protein
MTDSYGCFYISLDGNYSTNMTKNKNRVKCTFSIKQRVIDKISGKSCVPFMTEIADLFQCKIHYKQDNAMTFSAGANSKHYLTKAYFNKYPLMTSKYLNYLCFLEGLNYLGKPLNDKEINEIQTIKNSMNSKRTYYN